MVYFYYLIMQIVIQHTRLRKSVVYLIVILAFIVKQTHAGQCKYFVSNFSTVTSKPMNPLTNCLQYCIQYYSDKPQRLYYNYTSENCEPLRLCNSPASFYNYATNRCFNDSQYKIQADSYMPEGGTDGPDLMGQVSPTWNMVCVNGQIISPAVYGAPAFCICSLLWISSNKYDLNGNRFFCDVASQNPAGVFYNQLSFDKNGNITLYGPFTADQMDIMVKNLVSLQQYQESQFTLNQTDSIMYALAEYVPQEPIIRTTEYIYLAISLSIIVAVFGTSYWEFDKMRILTTQSKIKRRIMEALQQQNMVRDIL